MIGLEVQPNDSSETVVGRLRTRLGRERTLLVLDNCERLVQPVAELAHTLIASCPGLTLLATSQEPLGVPGEAVLAVTPMDIPEAGASALADLAACDAVALFCARAVGVRPEFALTAGNAGTVAAICRELDGIPLTIELAAARMRSMSVDAIAQHLRDYFQLLTGGPRTVPRHHTMRAALDWSYELMPPHRARRTAAPRGVSRPVHARRGDLGDHVRRR